jgi:hypothetical protein
MVRVWAAPGKPVDAGDEGSLGDWVGTITRDDDGRVLFLLLNTRTCLTVVFPAPAGLEFLERFTGALRAVLEDLDVPESAIDVETRGLRCLRLERASGTGFSGMLSRVESLCGLELLYHADLRLVQKNLNDVPHAGLEHGDPARTVKALLAGGGRAVKPRLH